MLQLEWREADMILLTACFLQGLALARAFTRGRPESKQCFIIKECTLPWNYK